MSREMRSESSPLGPFTETSSGSMLISTPEGTTIGLRPIRDMGLPDERDDFAADARGAGLVTGHHAARGGHDRGSHPALDLRDAALVDVEALARARGALEAADGARAILGVLQADAQQLAGMVLVGRLD